MPFLHFEAHRFCTDILFYDFHIKSIETSWYWKFMMTNHIHGHSHNHLLQLHPMTIVVMDTSLKIAFDDAQQLISTIEFHIQKI